MLLLGNCRCYFSGRLHGFFCASDNGGSDCCCNDCVIGIDWGFCGFFAAFNRIVVGIALTLTAIAAATLATRAATWTVTTFAAFLFIVLQGFFSVQRLFIAGHSGLFGAWLALFTRCARLTRFALRTLSTSFFANGCAVAWRCIQRLTQFAWLALFAWLTVTWLALFTRWTRLAHFLRLANFYDVTRAAFFTWRTFLARCALLTWCTLFAGHAWLAFFTRCTFFTWATLLTRCAVFARFALFTATTTVAILLTTVAAVITALRALAGFLLDNGRLFFFLAGEQADQ